MKLLLGLAVLVLTVGVLYSAPEDQPTGISEDTLRGEMAEKKCAILYKLVKSSFLAAAPQQMSLKYNQYQQQLTVLLISFNQCAMFSFCHINHIAVATFPDLTVKNLVVIVLNTFFLLLSL